MTRTVTSFARYNSGENPIVDRPIFWSSGARRRGRQCANSCAFAQIMRAYLTEGITRIAPELTGKTDCLPSKRLAGATVAANLGRGQLIDAGYPRISRSHYIPGAACSSLHAPTSVRRETWLERWFFSL